MDETRWLSDRFEAHRPHLKGVAYRMLGSSSEAEDAVQEAWINVSRAGAGGVDNIGGWLTTVVARVCLDMLRSRKARREDLTAEPAPEAAPVGPAAIDPEEEALLADSVGLALLVVLEALAPPERIAFVLHDLFSVPFEDIAGIVGRSPDAARQLASRARRRVQGAAAVPDDELGRQREVVAAFLAAMRGGDFEGIVAVLDPDVVARADVPGGPPREIRGARTWARGAVVFQQYARSVVPMLIDGAAGIVFAPGGRLTRALRLQFAGGKIAAVEVIADPERLAQLELAVLPD
jgi:RNA polymerase sigma-70 factor (ECF subfamily)